MVSVVAQLKPLIIKSYDKTPMKEFTYNWKQKILNNLQQYEIKKNKIDWGDISFGIIHGLIGLNNEETVITSSNPIIPPIVSPSASASTTSDYPSVHNETEITSPSNSSTNDTKTQLPLSAEDKEKNIWMLSSSTVVKKKR
ncbi:hypothetical protein BD770DRAFT_412153 [Pilaira anomala]|nr:hypothetical protein BD770DRAFT_412153 [Pilaira anomala]